MALARGCLQLVQLECLHIVKAALFVTALVTIANLQFNLLHALDSYAFLLVTRGSAIERDAAPRPQAVVVEIPQHTHESEYRDRSPLDRCVLLRHLQQIYAARPDVVAIDIDLAPALWLDAAGEQQRREFQCQEDLYALMQGRSTHSRTESGHHVTAVLIEPFAASPVDPDINVQKRQWQQRMVSSSAGGIRFGSAELPVNYGVTIDRAATPHSFAAAVASGSANAKAYAGERIDPRQYLSGLAVIQIDSQRSGDLSQALARALDESSRWNHEHKRVVFFGAAYGPDDLFLTPLGALYGVEVQAAAYATGPKGRHGHLLDLVLDLGIAWLLGLVIAFCWGMYFFSHMGYDTHPSRLTQQLAALWIVGLIACVLGALAVLSYGSMQLFAHCGVWLSPVPIAVGMLIDGFVCGSIGQARFVIARAREPHYHADGEPGQVTASQTVLDRMGSVMARLFSFPVFAELRIVSLPAALVLVARNALWLGALVWASILAIHG